ncbi:MAG: hypothetical protein WCA06_16735 [Terrimicrobiaceae bacterium]
MPVGPLRAELTKQSVRLVSRRQTAQSGLLEGNAADLSRLRASARSHQRLRNSLFVRSTPAKPTKRKLVFFDNVYIYGRVDGLMTEETPYNPCSRKGELRAQIAARLMEEGRKSHGNDRTGGHFYGPAALRTYQPPRDRPRCRWKAGMVAQQPKQYFTFTLGAGKALVRLALDDRAYQQVWHPPTCSTGRELIDICAQATGRTSRHITLTRPMIKLIGLFLR